MDDSRLYNGYDDYTGCFGPLQVSASSAIRSRGRKPPSRRGFLRSQSFEFPSKWSKGRRSATREFNDRAKFLANRKATKMYQPLKGDTIGADGLRDEENMPTSPSNNIQRQVWLPARNFTFRQRAGKLDIRAIARLDLEKIAATTDIETIQRHLDNLAFADVTLDDVQHYSDAYFLKLFQIAQLTLEYLMHVQDSLIDHSEVLEKQCEELMTECQQLESDNGQHETEIANLKREIRQKQRTMATLELMLLNASASNRINVSEKENVAREANAMVNDLMAGHAGSEILEEGSIPSAVSCVLCEKRFVSAEYLLRHQQRRHQNTTKKKKKGLSASSSNSDSQEKIKRKRDGSIPLPQEVVDALEAKNHLAKQLILLQDQVRTEQEARDRQHQQLESQHHQMSSRVEQYMEKLQALLVEIEKKQEVTKQDLRLYTQEAINRLQIEASNAELMRNQAQKTSHAGRLENDNGEEAVQCRDEESKWSAKVEKLMDTFLRAQVMKQQEIDTLEQESSKLWSKYNKLKKRQHRPEPRLVDLVALDAERFGLDRGELIETIETQKPIVFKAIAKLEDKVVQMDIDNEEKQSRRVYQAEELCKVIQTAQTPHKVPADLVPSVKCDETKCTIQPPAATASVSETAVIAFTEKVSALTNPLAKFQQAAHVIGKVALGFLARRAVAKSSNWCITMEIASLEAALTTDELEYVRQHFASRLQVQVGASMTANDLRVIIAKLLSGKDEFQVANELPVKSEQFEINATMTYHRVLLHHKHTGNELSGNTLVHELKNIIEVEIIPYHEIAAMQVRQVIESHAIASDRIESIKRTSMTMSASDLPALNGDDVEPELRGRNADLAHLLRLQALVRGFLAKKNVEIMKIDRLMDARLIQIGSHRKTSSVDNKTPKPSWMINDPVLAGEYGKVHRRMETVLRAILKQEEAGDENGLRILSQAEYKKLSADLLQQQKAHSSEVQRRVRLLTERLTPLATNEYRRHEKDNTQGVQTRTAGAAKFHRAVMVEVVRKRLKRLLADGGTHTSTSTKAKESDAFDHSEVTSLSLSSSRSTDHETGKSLGSFDPKEINQIASTYEEEKTPDVHQGPEDKEHEPLAADKKEIEEEDKAQVPLLLTPTMWSDDVDLASEEKSFGTTTPRPDPKSHTISPFSKTPLLSRAARRGTEVDDAK